MAINQEDTGLNAFNKRFDGSIKQIDILPSSQLNEQCIEITFDSSEAAIAFLKAYGIDIDAAFERYAPEALFSLLTAEDNLIVQRERDILPLEHCGLFYSLCEVYNQDLSADAKVKLIDDFLEQIPQLLAEQKEFLKQTLHALLIEPHQYQRIVDNRMLVAIRQLQVGQIPNRGSILHAFSCHLFNNLPAEDKKEALEDLLSDRDHRRRNFHFQLDHHNKGPHSKMRLHGPKLHNLQIDFVIQPVGFLQLTYSGNMYQMSKALNMAPVIRVCGIKATPEAQLNSAEDIVQTLLQQQSQDYEPSEN